MWWPFKNRFKKLRREEVVDSIIELTKREEELEANIENNAAQIAELMAKGKATKDPTRRLVYAKKINYLKSQAKTNTDRILYYLYNIELLNRLKDAIEDKEFIQTTSGVGLADLLGDQKHLAGFLNDCLGRKVKAEEQLTTADDIFNEVAQTYSGSERIYGVSKTDDELLAMFEEDEGLDLEEGATELGKPEATETPAAE